jgi:CheY-like chemotaxis protein
MESERDKQKILIIDDRRENIIFLANSILKPKGYDVITAMDEARPDHNGLENAQDEWP